MEDLKNCPECKSTAINERLTFKHECLWRFDYHCKCGSGPSHNEIIEKNWNKLIKIRNAVNASIETKRAEKLIGSSLEATVKVKLDNDYYNLANKYDFSEI
mgnify:CR=1 FL=1